MARWDHLKRYGLTAEDYQALLDAQGGVCAGCARAPRVRRLAVDHDHRSGAVRGLLCTRCNQLLGYCHENVALFERLAAYLRHPPADKVFTRPRLHRDAPEWSSDGAQ